MSVTRISSISTDASHALPDSLPQPAAPRNMFLQQRPTSHLLTVTLQKACHELPKENVKTASLKKKSQRQQDRPSSDSLLKWPEQPARARPG